MIAKKRDCNGRDWIRDSSSKNYIGHDIKKIIHGSVNHASKEQLDHLAETFDEREKNKEYNLNLGRKSHRRRYIVNSKKDLNILIQKIIDNDDKDGGILGAFYN